MISHGWSTIAAMVEDVLVGFEDAVRQPVVPASLALVAESQRRFEAAAPARYLWPPMRMNALSYKRQLAGLNLARITALSGA